jgi:transposase
LLYKSPNHWTENQKVRALILFNEYPDIKIAFDLVQGLRHIFNTSKTIHIAYTKLAYWYKDVELAGGKSFNTIVNTM